MNPKRLKALRLRAKLTQSEVAKLLRYDSASIVTMWENGERKVPSDKLPALAAALGCTIGELFDEQPGSADTDLLNQGEE